MATKERLIVKTSYMDVLERMLRKRGVKAVMSGVRNYHKSINNSYKRERATVKGSSILYFIDNMKR